MAKNNCFGKKKPEKWGREGLVGKCRYSSPCQVKLSPKYSALPKNRKVKNKASILHVVPVVEISFSFSFFRVIRSCIREIRVPSFFRFLSPCSRRPLWLNSFAFFLIRVIRSSIRGIRVPKLPPSQPHEISINFLGFLGWPKGRSRRVEGVRGWFGRLWG
jgi:hypothetical protein